jgi:hypothetical protein
MRHASCAMCHAPCAMRHAPCVMCHVPCVICHVPCAMCHASCAMRHAPCAMRHAPCAMRHAPCHTDRVVSTKFVVYVTTVPHDRFRPDQDAPRIPTRAAHDADAQKITRDTRKAEKTRKCPISGGPRRAFKTRSGRHAALSARPHAAPTAPPARPPSCTISSVKIPAADQPTLPAARVERGAPL